MKFTYPFVLWALVIILIPIIIHLLNLRKFKPLLFPNVLFLSKVKEQTKKRSNVKRWIQLLLRTLAFALLVLAFAQPYFPAKLNQQTSGKPLVCIYLDNSFSMENTNANGELFEQAKQEAINIVKLFENSANFIFTNNNFEPTHLNPCSPNQAIQYIQNTSLTGQKKDFYDVYTRQTRGQELGREQGQNKLNGRILHFYLSDFQENQFSTEQLPTDSTNQHILIQFSPENQSNISIDSLWLNNPHLFIGSKQNLTIQLTNRSENDVNDFPISVESNNNQQQLTVDLKANKSTLVNTEFVLNQASNTGKISISDFPITFDNQLLFAFETSEHINIHSLAKNYNSGLQKLFLTDSLFSTTSSTFSSPNLQQLEQSDIILLLGVEQLSDGLKNKFSDWLKKGKSVVLIPNKNAISNLNNWFNTLSISEWNKLNTTKVSVNQWEFNHPLLSSVLESKPKKLNYPIVNHFFSTKNSNGINIASATTQPLIEQFTVGNGKLYRINATLDSNTVFFNHALVLTTLYRMGEMVNQAVQPYFISGASSEVLVNKVLMNDETFEVSNGDERIVPFQIPQGKQTKLSLPQSLLNSDFYNIFFKGNNVNTFALNYNRDESSATYHKLDNLTTQLKLNGWQVEQLDYSANKTISAIKELTQKSALWTYCLWIMLLFLTLEILINKRW